MFVSIIAVNRGGTQVQQVEAPTVKDCLVAWAGRVRFDGLTDEGRTRLRGDMADFNEAPYSGMSHLWKLQTDLGPEIGPVEVFVVETPRT